MLLEDVLPSLLLPKAKKCLTSRRGKEEEEEEEVDCVKTSRKMFLLVLAARHPLSSRDPRCHWVYFLPFGLCSFASYSLFKSQNEREVGATRRPCNCPLYNLHQAESDLKDVSLCCKVHESIDDTARSLSAILQETQLLLAVVTESRHAGVGMV